MNDSDVALRVSDLEVTLEGAHVLRKISFAVPSGQTIGLAGHNGAGKTTTLRAIMGLVRSHGEILLHGKSITRLQPADRARLGIGYAPDDRRLITAMNVAENLKFPAEVCAFPAAKVAKQLAAIRELLPELAELERRPAGFLSGGQQKMAALGRALMIGETLLLLDEPFQGLAPALARRYAEALRNLRRQRPDLAILITESNPSLLTPLAGQVYQIERGEIASAPALSDQAQEPQSVRGDSNRA